MARTTYAPKQSYTGNGTLASYTFDFKIEELSQLLVIEVDDSGVETQRVRGTDIVYLSSVDFDPVDGAGTVNLAANLANNYKLFILLANDAPTQPYEFRNKGSFSLKRIELALDFLTGIIQRLTLRSSQSIKINDTDDETTFDTTLPRDIANNTEKFLQVNAAGTGLQFGEGSGDKLPAGGGAEDLLGKIDATDGNVEWKVFDFAGYSARFTEAFSSTGLRDTLNKILDLQYAAPLVNLTASGSTTVREKGDPVASTNLTAAVTKTSDDIARIQFFKDGVSIDDNNPPVVTGTGNTLFTYNAAPFSDDTTFRVDVTDDGTSGGPSTTVSSRNFTFVYPYYSGAGVPGLTAAQVAALTKDIRTSNSNLNKSFTTSNGDVYYFAYPASYGALTSILDENSFETIGDWTLRTENITGLDASAVSYRIYEFNNPVVAGSTDYTFIR